VLPPACVAQGVTTDGVKLSKTRRKRQQALADLLGHLEAERGGLDTAEDEAEITRCMRLLGGRAEEPGERRAG
jgi:hypothetical protein